MKAASRLIVGNNSTMAASMNRLIDMRDSVYQLPTIKYPRSTQARVQPAPAPEQFDLTAGESSPFLGYPIHRKSLTLIGIDPGVLSEIDPPNPSDWARRLGQDGPMSSRSRRSKMNSRLFRQALSTFGSSPALRPRGPCIRSAITSRTSGDAR